MRHITLKAARKQKRLTQRELEAKSGVEQPVISKLESGAVTDPNWSTVRKLERGLKVRFGTLVFGEEAKELAS